MYHRIEISADVIIHTVVTSKYKKLEGVAVPI